MRRAFTMAAPKWQTVTQPVVDDIAKAATAAMDEVAPGLKNELRLQVTSAGMGARLGNTWQGRRYPNASPSIDAAAFVFSKAPEIVDAFDRAPVIRTVNGRRYLAIPTKNVPRAAAGAGVRGSTHRMSPAEVETYFNQDLKFARAGNGRLIAYIDATGTSGGSFKRATGRQLGRLYRGIKAPPRHAQIVMFIMTPTVRMPKRFDVDSAANHWADQVSPILERKLAALS